MFINFCGSCISQFEQNSLKIINTVFIKKMLRTLDLPPPSICLLPPCPSPHSLSPPTLSLTALL